jgi:hypothetical protein
MQSAQIAGMNAKFPSSLTKIGQFTARHVGQHGDPLDRSIDRDKTLPPNPLLVYIRIDSKSVLREEPKND